MVKKSFSCIYFNSNTLQISQLAGPGSAKHGKAKTLIEAIQ